MNNRLRPKSNLSSASRVSVKERDYLEQDAPIRGQEFVCISFISPEDEIQNKEIFSFFEFTKNFSRDVDGMLTNLTQKFEETQDNSSKDMIKALRERYDYLFNSQDLEKQYRYFKMVNSDRLEKEYSEKNDFRTNVRGIKVRGVYSNIEEAKNRAAYLKKIDPKSPDIYIGQVGCWCPWSPYPEEIQDQEYSETDLNTLMKKYKENEEEKNQHYEQRKQMLTSQLEQEKKKILEQNEVKEQEQGQKEEYVSQEEQISVSENEDKTTRDKLFEEQDPWMKNKTNA